MSDDVPRNPARCYQCPKPAMYAVGEQNIPLCLECYFKFFQMAQAQIENAERQMNFAMDEMDMIMGIPSFNRFPTRKAVNLGGVTLHNIKVDNSTVGSVNTGTIGSLDVAISSVRETDERLAEALTQLSQAVVNNATLERQHRDEIFEILSTIASEAAAPKEQQRISIVRILLDRLREVMTLANDLYAIWERWHPVVTGSFGIQ